MVPKGHAPPRPPLSRARGIPASPRPRPRWISPHTSSFTINTTIITRQRRRKSHTNVLSCNQKTQQAFPRVETLPLYTSKQMPKRLLRGWGRPHCMTVPLFAHILTPSLMDVYIHSPWPRGSSSSETESAVCNDGDASLTLSSCDTVTKRLAVRRKSLKKENRQQSAKKRPMFVCACSLATKNFGAQIGMHARSRYAAPQRSMHMRTIGNRVHR